MVARDLDRVMEPGYLDGLGDRPVEELRTMRETCQQVESRVSYARRLVQGRLDIVRAEARRRAERSPSSGLAELVDSLPSILADGPRASGPGRMPTNLLPPEEDEGLVAEIEAVAGAETMGSLPDLDDERISQVAAGLADLESRLSRERRRLFEVIDGLQDEVARRYSAGLVDPGTILS